MKKSLSALSVTGFICATILLGPAAAYAGCRESFCVSGRDIGKQHVVNFTNSNSNVHHYNARVNPPLNIVGSVFSSQVEVGRNVRSFTIIDLPSTRPVTIEYSIQACAYGGFPPHSNCGPWTTFHHAIQ
ncbi:hypothetical protein [Bradyrhizobium sp. 21]|uniref:hypothetical protein n=1 Tax=Bradyrhizobium sp. 21 TaxID=2782666 RepID=UPI001FFACB7B|nr:hypothetical protein [Bradyrhizobium sp. 21]MCK1386336.1 hypothetical protein [Bradyrhizobium sp. 21]